MKIGNRLRSLRAEKGFTQETLADLLNIPQATYSNLENDKGKIDLNLLEKLSNIYEMDLLDLLNKESFNFYNEKNKGGNNGLVINMLSEKIIEQYDFRLKEKDIFIAHLQSIIRDLKL